MKTAQPVEEHRSERVDIRFCIGLLSAKELGRRISVRFAELMSSQGTQTDAAHVQLSPFGHQNVGHLQVSMQDLVLMGMAEGRGQCGKKIERLPDCEPLGSCQELGQVETLHILHDHGSSSADLGEAQEADDMGVLQSTRQACFGQERLNPISVLQ